ncbi:MAG: carboxypeptidase-like regulatory domain-containing protein [Salinivirgaceae bacterium]
MRKKILFALLIVLIGLPNLLVAQTKRISINMTNSSLNDVLNEIEKQSDYTFLVNQEIVDINRKVVAVFENTPISTILDSLLKSENIEYVISNKQIILTPKKKEPVKEEIKPIKVSGKIIDVNSQEPIPGVTILIKGTTIGAITDYEGKYSIEVTDANSSLTFSFIGYKTQTIALEGKTTFNIIMEEDTKSIDEVVITALGIKRETKALGYSVQSVEGEGLQKVKGVDVATSLTGKVAGLAVYNSTEFAEEPVIQIRGEVPILVIDGVPYGNMSLRDVPTDDIESMSVLKGATASALYGYRAASGAIMITTKKGSNKKGMTVSFNSSNMFAAGYLAIPETQSTYGREVNTATNTAVSNGDGSWGPPLEGQEVIQWDPISKTMKPMPYLPIGKSNFKNYVEQGYVLNNNINLIQQGEIGSFRVSATSVQNKGQYPNSMLVNIHTAWVEILKWINLP